MKPIGLSLVNERSQSVYRKVQHSADTTPSLNASAKPQPIDDFRRAFEGGHQAEAERLAAALRNVVPQQAIEVWSKLGLLRRRAGRVVAAVEAFEAASARANDAALTVPEWLNSELSGCFMQQREWARALTCAEAGVRLKPMLGLTACSALLRLGRPDEARTWLIAAVQALAPDPARASAVAATCVELLAEDGSTETQGVVTRAAGAWSGAPSFGPVLTTLSMLQRDDLVAEEDRARAAVAAAPDSEAAAFRWRDLLARRLTPDAVTDALAELQDRTALVLPALLLVLARRMSIDALLTRFEGQIATWRRSEAAVACEAYHTAVCDLAPPSPRVIERVVAVPVVQLRLFVLLRTPRLRAIRVREPDAAGLAALTQAGVDVAAVQTLLAEMVGPLEPAWDAYLNAATFASDDAQQIVRTDEGFSAFQDRIVRDQAFAMVDPISGGPADLVDSVKIHDRQVFAFRGQDLFTVQSGGNMNFLLFIHLLRQNLILLVDTRKVVSKQGFYASDAYVAEVQAIWLRRAAQNHAALLRAAAAARCARGSRRRIVVIHGRAENPAHHVWNYLPPFERLALAGTLGNVAAVLEPPTRYFGPLAALFPELAEASMLEQAEAAAIDPCPFSPDAIALQLGSSFIPETLRSRIRRWAEAAAPAACRAEITGLSGRPIVWIGLRVGDKVWVEQATGIAGIIDLIVPLFPDTVFLLDGFSVPDEASGPSEKWRGAARRLEEEAARIIAATAHPDAVRSLVGNRLSESVLWAQAATAYFTPLGSSQHKVGWFGSAAGLVYTTGKLTRTPANRRQGAWEAENSPLPHFLIGTVAEPGERRGAYDYRTNLETVSFPMHVAARRLLAILGQAELGVEA